MNFKIGILNWLTVLLVALKLFDFIAISWWLVFTPTFVWLGIVALVIAMVIVILIVGAARGEDVISKMDEFNKRNRKRDME